ncbi:hypothetical protein GM612_10985 [Lactobacillus sp. CRM56-3]|uniref:Uncharacterized protein n=1 Tax=Secundilactobacillus folii TaxID=2678357 RepID=A0A7X2XWY5_9LACO|nr:hypothetical protein [Secundilactobacillus folii]
MNQIIQEILDSGAKSLLDYVEQLVKQQIDLDGFIEQLVAQAKTMLKQVATTALEEIDTHLMVPMKHAHWQVHDLRPRKVVTEIGELQINRRYYVSNQERCYPLD